MYGSAQRKARSSDVELGLFFRAVQQKQTTAFQPRRWGVTEPPQKGFSGATMHGRKLRHQYSHKWLHRWRVIVVAQVLYQRPIFPVKSKYLLTAFKNTPPFLPASSVCISYSFYLSAKTLLFLDQKSLVATTNSTHQTLPIKPYPSNLKPQHPRVPLIYVLPP